MRRGSFWTLSGNDFFLSAKPRGTSASLLQQRFTADAPERGSRAARVDRSPETPRLFVSDGRLFEISSRALTFGSGEQMTGLGYVTIGYALDEKVAREVSEAAAADVDFVVDGKIVAGTLPQALRQKLASSQVELLRRPIESQEMRLGGERTWLHPCNCNRKPQPAALFNWSYSSRSRGRADSGQAEPDGDSSWAFLRPCSAWRWPLRLPARSRVRWSRWWLPRARSAEEIFRSGFARRARRRCGNSAAPSSDAGPDAEDATGIAGGRTHGDDRPNGQFGLSRLRHYLSAIYANAEFLANPRIPARNARSCLKMSAPGCRA